MNILFLCHKIPYPPNKGDRIPTYHRVRFLSQRHKLHLVFPCFYQEELKYLDELRKYSDSIHTTLMPAFWSKLKSLFYLFSFRPLTLPYFYSKKLSLDVKRILKEEKIDLIYVYSSSMAQYVMDAMGVRKIMDFADADSHKWLQYFKFTWPPLSWVYFLEYLKMKAFEKKVAKNFDSTIAISEDEKKLFGSYIKDLKMDVVNNGVDLEYFKPREKGYNLKQLIFVGAMDYIPNIDAVTYFFQQILPLVKEKVPDVKFYIVGGRPSAAVKKLAEDRSVVVTGFADDVRKVLTDSAVCVAPLRIARGVQNKILEAMAAGVPVVTTSKGNEGINARRGEDIFVEDDPRSFAQRIVELLNNSLLRNQTARNARGFVEKNHNWQVNLEKLEKIGTASIFSSADVPVKMEAVPIFKRHV